MSRDTIMPKNLIESLNFLIEEKIRRDGKGKISASTGKGAILCIYHEEVNPSLLFNLHKGLVKCFGCGKKTSLSEFLRDLKESLGYEWSSADADYKKLKETERFLPKVKNEVVFVYTDETGKPLCYKWRRDYEDGKKDFNLFNPDGEEMSHFFGLYSLHLVAKANEVYFVEGEKVADALIQLGLVATTLCRGASGKLSKPERQSLLSLKGKKVFLCTDADKSGFQYMSMVKKFLQKKGINAHLVKLPDSLSDGEDLFDFVQELKEQGLSSEEIKQNVINLTKMDTGVPFNEVQAKPTEWVISDWLPKGKLSLICGRPGLGKTRLAIVLGCVKANGMHIFTADGFKEVEPGVVFYFTFEDNPESLAHWVDTVGIARNSNIRIFSPETIYDIIRPIKEYKPSLAIIDPLNYLVNDENTLKDIKPILEPLVNLAKNLKISILGTWHQNKKNTNDVMLAISGHNRVAALSKRLIMLEKQDDRVVAHFAKTKASKPVAFFASEDKFEWIKSNDIESFGRHIPQSEEVANLIRQELLKEPYELDYTSIKKLVEPYGISDANLKAIASRHLKDVIKESVRDSKNRIIGWRWKISRVTTTMCNSGSNQVKSSISSRVTVSKNIAEKNYDAEKLNKINNLQEQKVNDAKNTKIVTLENLALNQHFLQSDTDKTVTLAQMAKKNQNSLKNQDFFSLKVPIIPKELLKKYQLDNPELYGYPDFREILINHVIDYSRKSKPNKLEGFPTVIINGVEYIDADELFKMEGLIC